nr:MAG TPA: hypothetical protein [Caudoviricetes sp.]
MTTTLRFRRFKHFGLTKTYLHLTPPILSLLCYQHIILYIANKKSNYLNYIFFI